MPAMDQLSEMLAGQSVFVLGATASLAASVGTAFGALPVLGVRSVSQRAQDVLASIAAGLMLAATTFALVVPALEAAAARYGSEPVAASVVIAGLFAGAAALLVVHRYAPHEHLGRGREGPLAIRLRRAWLLVIALTLHNFPEGLAVGVGFGGGDVGNGLALAAAIFLQNMPEGFLVAFALAGQGYSRRFALVAAGGTGMVETLGGLAGAGAVAAAAATLPWAMAFAAGAMLFVISHEIIPETHRNGYELEATVGLLAGFALMLQLQSLFG